VPYAEGYERKAEGDLRAQAARVAEGLTRSGFTTSADREIVAMIAYLQRLGTDIKPQKIDADVAAIVPGTGGQ
jgi:cytochrome c oxidase cbb3-type subunit I/II